MLRATLKSLLARKLRLTLSTLAVVLSVMFVAGSFVLTDTLQRSFDSLFANIYTYTDVQIQGKSNLGGDNGAGTAQPIPASVLDRVKTVEGVRSAKGQVFANGANVIGKNGKLVPNNSGTRFGAGWSGEDELVKLSAGGPPQADDQVVLNKGLLDAGTFALGDQIDIKFPDATRRTFKVVGVFQYSGGRDSMAGEQTVYFTEPAAQQLMIGQTGVFTSIDVKTTAGVSKDRLRDNLKSALGDQYDIKTGPELAKASSEPFKQFFKYINYVLLGFSAVALLVGVFLILNTFSIIVAQRTGELALLRAMGASRRQVTGSVLLEALLIGVVGSAVGFGVGVGIGAGGAAVLSSLVGSVKLAGIGVPAAAWISAFTVGITVTVVAALLPAFKAARVAPIAAMRAAAATDRPLTRITIVGGVVTAIAGAALAKGLTGAGSGTLPLILFGVLLLLVGVALLTPLLSKPVVSLLGALFAWSIPGKLGRRNSSRNPRRTAITAAAIMIGIAVITAISTVFTSLSASVATAVDKEVQADLIVAGQQTSAIPPTLSPGEIKGIRALSAVDTVAVDTYSAAKVNGADSGVIAFDDIAAAQKVLKLKTVEGSLASLGTGQLSMDKRTATDLKIKLGDRMTVTLPKATERSYTVVAITEESNTVNGFLISQADAETGFQTALPLQAFVKVKPGVDVNAVKAQITDVIKNNPEANVQTRKEYIGTTTQFFDVLLGAVQALLLVALVISGLGVINTLVLSVIERTREVGMLRAIGLRRSQTMRMITVESVVISLFGTVLGLAVGAGLGASVVKALKEAAGIGDISLPYGLMVMYLIASLFVGVLAAVIPAIWAARLNVLGAIAYE